MNKEYIINSFNKNEFMHFLQNDYKGEILDLFDEEGLNILKNSPLCSERIQYILCYSKYKNEILCNSNFLDIFLNTNISNYYAVLGDLRDNTYDIILEKCIELNKSSSDCALIFSYFNTNYKLNRLDNWPYSEELLYSILKVDEMKVINKIINNYNIDLLKYDINLEDFFEKAKHSTFMKYESGIDSNEIHIPPHMITKDVASKLWNTYDIFKSRAIISNAEYSIDSEIINNYFKLQEEKIIKNCLTNELIYPFNELYSLFEKYVVELKSENYDDDKVREYRMNYIRFINKIGNEEFNYKIVELYDTNGLIGVKEYLKQLNNNYISNYIIDYHFEENYHNIIIDVRELLNFYFNGNIELSMDKIEIYNKISNIDYLSLEEKIELHELLKSFNMKETFYDDMSMARHLVGQMIKDYSISQSELVKYKNQELSNQYGVDVYVLDGEPFFGIVKTGTHFKDQYPAGHSYSLVGANGLAVYGDVKESSTFLYNSDEMNPDQLVHVFPFDSYTYYQPFKYNESATRRVNMLSNPEELLNISKSYTELLMLEKGKNKTDIDSSIPELKRIALYCIDEIQNKDVEVAQANDVGIILINSKKYKKNNENIFSSPIYHIGEYEYNYFNGSYEKDKFEARRI